MGRIAVFRYLFGIEYLGEFTRTWNSCVSYWILSNVQSGDVKGKQRCQSGTKNSENRWEESQRKSDFHFRIKVLELGPVHSYQETKGWGKKKKKKNSMQKECRQH